MHRREQLFGRSRRLYIGFVASIVLRPGRQRSSATPIIAKGLVYLLQNPRAHTVLHLNRRYITKFFNKNAIKAEKPYFYKVTIKTPLYLSVSEDRKCASTACPLVFLRFLHDTDMGEVDVDLLFRMLFVPFAAFMDDNLGYKGV